MTAADDESTTQLPRRVKISDAVAFHEMDGQTVLLDLEHSFYYELDDVGTSMFQLLREQPDPEHVVTELLHKYEVDEAAVRRDLSALLAQLAEAHLITVEVV